jgi:hypothetical protein
MTPAEYCSMRFSRALRNGSSERMKTFWARMQYRFDYPQGRCPWIDSPYA